MSHTPGPWEALPNNGQIILNGSNCYAVREVFNDGCGFNPDDIRLMAAEPDMLAALMRMRDEFGTCSAYKSQDDACLMADAAILKAEGSAK